MKNSIVNTLVIATAATISGCQRDALPGDVGSPPPVYAAPILMRPDSVRVAQMKGSVVLLNVWATWCIPCRKEIPELQALHQQFSGRGLKVVGVSVDEAGTDDDVAGFAKDFGVTYTIVRDPDDRISELFRTPGVPSSFLIDRKGIVRWRKLGPFAATDTDFNTALQKTLQET
ncbi:MAG TPA: TlpA disulfide reductase family protein [Longimicrobiales bacterium]|nr:TlpA disulfide reductase family protein [Longimicrobiales bacterium]